MNEDNNMMFFIATSDYESIATGMLHTTAPREIYLKDLDTMTSCVLNPMTKDIERVYGKTNDLRLVIIDSKGFEQALKNKDY